jgi:nitrogen-specific signal transduction histidine kinase
VGGSPHHRGPCPNPPLGPAPAPPTTACLSVVCYDQLVPNVSTGGSFTRNQVHEGPAVLRNLITNAQRYGGHQIHGDSAHIRVSDNGDGIPESDQERIFAPYESAHDPGTQPGSLGLGLTISRSLARLMGGDPSYHRVDGWTTFDFRLPLQTEPLLDDLPATVEFKPV